MAIDAPRLFESVRRRECATCRECENSRQTRPGDLTTSLRTCRIFRRGEGVVMSRPVAADLPIEPPTVESRLAELGDCRLSQIPPEDPPERVADCPFALKGYRNILSGRGGRGKSTFLYQLAAAVSSGNHYLGHGADPYGELKMPPPGGVLLLTDEPPARVAARMSRYQPPMDGDIDSGVYDYQPDRIRVVPVNDMPSPQVLHHAIDEWGIDLLIIDPLRRLIMRGLDREDFDSVWSAIEDWIPMGMDCATVGLHHQHRERDRAQSDTVTKGFGVSSWFDSMDIVTDFDLVKGGSEGDRVLTCGKSRVDDLRYGQEVYLDWAPWNSYAYGPGEKPAHAGTRVKPAKVVGLSDRVREYLAKHPAASKSSVAVAVGVKKGGSASYRVFSEAFEATRTAMDGGVQK